jgi:hypothetical protein
MLQLYRFRNEEEYITMIEAGRYSTNDVRTIYSRRSRVYSKTIAPLEFPNHVKAIERAAIRPNEAVLEVAVGPGWRWLSLPNMLRRLIRFKALIFRPECWSSPGKHWIMPR